MKILKFAVLSLAAACMSVSFAEEAPAAPKSLKVLMIGNSFSLQMVRSMPPVAKDLDLRLDICSLYIGGCSLELHCRNVEVGTTNAMFRPYTVSWSYASLEDQSEVPFADDLSDNVWKDWRGEHKEKKGNIPALLKGDKWDIVTIQQASHFSWKPHTYHPWGDDLVKTVRALAPQAKIVVQETWSYTPWDRRFESWGFDQNEMYARLHAAYAEFAKGYGFDIIPTGTAVQLVRKELPVKYTENSFGGDVVGSAKFVEKDGKWVPEGDVFHMGGSGNYLQALVWTAKLFGVDVTKVRYVPDGIESERAEFLRRMAMKAVTGGTDAR